MADDVIKQVCEQIFSLSRYGLRSNLSLELPFTLCLLEVFQSLYN